MSSGFLIKVIGNLTQGYDTCGLERTFLKELFY
jgi:hypothetical protein